MFEFLKFKIWIFQTTSDGETTKIKNVDPKKVYNFIVANFFILNHLLKFKFFKWPKQKLYNFVFANFSFEIIYLRKIIFEFLTFEIWIFQTTSDGETTKMKVVDHEKLWNFVADNFFIWNHLVKENYVWISHIWNLNFSNILGWRNNKNKSCRSRKVIRRQLFYLISSCLVKLCLNFSHLKFEFFKSPRIEKQQK